jgi:hypothetical protein
MARKQARFGQPAVYNASAPTLTDGDDSALNVDASGNTLVSQATLLAGEDIANDVIKTENRYSYATITTATTTTVKSGAGFLHRIVVTGGTTGTIVIYDNTAASGTKIADFDTTNAIASYEFNVSYTTGLTIVTSAATKITVSYR